MNLPTRKQCFDLLKKYRVPQHVIDHSLQVNKVAVFLGQKMQTVLVSDDNHLRPEINLGLIDRASLLHDLLRVVDIPLEKLGRLPGLFNKGYTDVGTKEDLDFWQGLQKKYPGWHHADAVADVLQGDYPELAQVIRQHNYDSLFTALTWEEKIVNYADKRVMHDQITDLATRLDEGQVRGHHPDTPAGRKRHQEIKQRLIEIENEIFGIIKLDPKVINKLNSA